VEIERFQLQQFTVGIKEVAEWFGLEVARDRGGRMPASATELNLEGPSTLLNSPAFARLLESLNF
jgi:hypothetical protein